MLKPKHVYFTLITASLFSIYVDKSILPAKHFLFAVNILKQITKILLTMS
ncbi:MAG: hypothetical protein BWY62_00305 [Firmicutes bacterium ADurb.Bin356]|nr:MAG: hypothetical protein BWY62_00305 [Firmicutes bacterium ADurb.Bin356]